MRVTVNTSRLVLLLAALCLAGCAQLASLTPDQKRAVIGVSVGALVLGAIAADDDDTVVIQEPECSYKHKHCR